jgi:hypothetical protein
VSNWKRANEVYVRDGQGSPTIVFSGDGTSAPPLHYPPRQWNIVDLKPFGVPADAAWAMISANVIITDQNVYIDTLTMTVRNRGSVLGSGNYQLQAMSVFEGGGARGRQGPVTVTLVDGTFEMYWEALVAGQPENGNPSTFLINATLDAWGRDAPPDQLLSAATEARIAALEAQIAAPVTVDLGSITDRITQIEAELAAIRSGRFVLSASLVTD